MCIKDKEKLDKWIASIVAATGKVRAFLENASMKLDPLVKVPFVGDSIAQAQDIVYMLNDYYRGNYKRVPFTAIIGATLIVAYLASPYDLIPDNVPILGFVDDALIINVIVSLCLDRELEEYRRWRSENNEIRQLA